MRFVPCNVQVRTQTSATDVAKVISPIIAKHAEISTPHNSWITILDEASLGDSADELLRVANAISTALKALTISIWFPEEDSSLLSAFDSGRCLVSIPVMSTDETFFRLPDTAARDAAALALLPFVAEADKSRLGAFLDPNGRKLFSKDRVFVFAELFGIREDLIQLDFVDFVENALGDPRKARDWKEAKNPNYGKRTIGFAK